jgi:hypothetical protein
MKLNSFEKWNDVLSSLNIPVDTNSFRIVINDDFSALQVEY